MEPSEPIRVNRAPVLTLCAAIVAERLGNPPDTALTLGRAVSGSAAGVAATDTTRLAEVQVTAPVLLLGKTIRLLPTKDDELRAADIDQRTDHTSVERYLVKAFGDRLAEVRAAMERLAATLPPQELNRVGFKMYERFRPDVPSGAEGWGAKGCCCWS